MSKGHGRIQRLILSELAAQAMDPYGPWLAVAELGSNRSDKQAVRRAMKRLAEEGFVELSYRPLHDPIDDRVRTHLCATITDEGLRHLLGRGE